MSDRFKYWRPAHGAAHQARRVAAGDIDSCPTTPCACVHVTDIISHPTCRTFQVTDVHTVSNGRCPSSHRNHQPRPFGRIHQAHSVFPVANLYSLVLNDIGQVGRSTVNTSLVINQTEVIQLVPRDGVTQASSGDIKLFTVEGKFEPSVRSTGSHYDTSGETYSVGKIGSADNLCFRTFSNEPSIGIPCYRRILSNTFNSGSEEGESHGRIPKEREWHRIRHTLPYRPLTVDRGVQRLYGYFSTTKVTHRWHHEVHRTAAHLGNTYVVLRMSLGGTVP